MAHPPRRVTRPELLEKVRKLCLELPETSEKEAWGGPTFRVRGKMFVMHMDNHHDDGRVALWCCCSEEERDFFVESDPERFFVPPYVGHKGWLGVRLDKRLAWKRIIDIVEEAYLLTAPAKLAAIFD